MFELSSKLLLDFLALSLLLVPHEARPAICLEACEQPGGYAPTSGTTVGFDLVTGAGDLLGAVSATVDGTEGSLIIETEQDICLQQVYYHFTYGDDCDRPKAFPETLNGNGDFTSFDYIEVANTGGGCLDEIFTPPTVDLATAIGYTEGEKLCVSVYVEGKYKDNIMSMSGSGSGKSKDKGKSCKGNSEFPLSGWASNTIPFDCQVKDSGSKSGSKSACKTCGTYFTLSSVSGAGIRVKNFLKNNDDGFYGGVIGDLGIRNTNEICREQDNRLRAVFTSYPGTYLMTMTHKVGTPDVLEATLKNEDTSASSTQLSINADLVNLRTTCPKFAAAPEKWGSFVINTRNTGSTANFWLTDVTVGGTNLGSFCAPATLVCTDSPGTCANNCGNSAPTSAQQIFEYKFDTAALGIDFVTADTEVTAKLVFCGSDRCDYGNGERTRVELRFVS